MSVDFTNLQRWLSGSKEVSFFFLFGVACDFVSISTRVERVADNRHRPEALRPTNSVNRPMSYPDSHGCYLGSSSLPGLGSRVEVIKLYITLRALVSGCLTRREDFAAFSCWFLA